MENEKENARHGDTQNPTRVSRRSFLSSLARPALPQPPVRWSLQRRQHRPLRPTNTTVGTVPETIAGANSISLRVNGKQFDLQVDPRTSLLDCLRTIRITSTDLPQHTIRCCHS